MGPPGKSACYMDASTQGNACYMDASLVHIMLSCNEIQKCYMDVV